MKTTLRNEFNGHRRKVGGLTAFLGSAFFGPLYFLIKGAWPAFFATGFVLFLCAAANPGFGLFVNVVFISPFAATIVRRHYLSRGFTRESSTAITA